MRNAYALINFGDFVDGGLNTAPPFVQLLSITNSTQAHQDFVNARLGGVDKANYNNAYLVLSRGESRPTKSLVSPKVVGIIEGACVGLVVLIVVVMVLFVRRSSKKRNAPSSSGQMGSYVPLSEPSSASLQFPQSHSPVESQPAQYLSPWP